MRTFRYTPFCCEVSLLTIDDALWDILMVHTAFCRSVAGVSGINIPTPMNVEERRCIF